MRSTNCRGLLRQCASMRFKLTLYAQPPSSGCLHGTGFCHSLRLHGRTRLPPHGARRTSHSQHRAPEKMLIDIRPYLSPRQAMRIGPWRPPPLCRCRCKQAISANHRRPQVEKPNTHDRGHNRCQAHRAGGAHFLAAHSASGVEPMPVVGVPCSHYGPSNSPQMPR
jgi:hypothetical protein